MKLFKSALSVLLCLCMLVATIVPAFATDNEEAQVPETTIIYGDADVDGDVDMQDLLLMEKHIAGKDVTISELHADVNADGYIDKTDVQMLRDYLVGNIDSLCPDLVTVSFDTDGGGDFEPIKVGRGYGIVKDLPTPAKPDYIFTGWLRSDGSEFYKEDAITEDVTLVAQYESIEKQEKINIDSYAVTDCEPDIKFTVKGDFGSAEEVKSNITLVPKDGSDPVEIAVTDNGDGTYKVGAAVGFNPGSSYELELGEGLNFIDKEDHIRKVNFVIIKAEGDRIAYNDNVKFVRDTDDMDYYIDGESEKRTVIESTLLENGEDQENKIELKGYFVNPSEEVNKDDILCIFEGTHPNERDYTKDNYAEESIAYVCVKDIVDGKYYFESLNEEDASKVLLMPDTIPFKVDQLPTGDKGSVEKDKYDAAARVALKKTEAPEYNKGDFLVFYTADFDELEKDSEVVYAKVEKVDGNIVYFEVVTKDYVEDFMGLFVRNDITKEEILKDLDEDKLLEQVKNQVEKSNFAEESVGVMFQSALEKDEVKDALFEQGMTKKEFNYYASGGDINKAPTGARLKISVEGISIQPSIIKGNKFHNGVGVALEVHVVLSVDAWMGSNTHSLKIDLGAYFEEEVEVGFDVNVEDEWTWYFIIPVLEELSCYVSIDVKSYTSASLTAALYTIKEASVGKLYQYVFKVLQRPGNYRNIRNYDKVLASSVKFAKGTQAWNDIQDTLGYLEASLPKVEYEGKTYTFLELRELFNYRGIETDFAESVNAENEDDAKVGMQQLMDKYSELLENETDWVNIASVKVFDRDINVKVVAINFNLKLNLSVNVNISMGAEIEYQVGKRYNFWIHVISCQAGSNEMDILDEKFGFQLYVMGSLGLRIGIKIEITFGLLSTKIASIGGNVEFGPYLKLWGYCCYVYTKHRPANSIDWNVEEEMKGALYLEFGLFLVVRFKAQAIDGIFKFEPVLYEGEYPILLYGKEKNAYSFASDNEDESLKIYDQDNYAANGITMNLSSAYRRMKVMNLKTGEQTQEVYDESNFIFSSNSKYFRVNDSGIVTVEVPDNREYLESEITITWKNSKLGFSKYDMSITIPVYWTSLTDDQIKEKHTASVVVGNPVDGYTTVWSGRYTRLEEFDLPEKEEILELIKYDSYIDENGDNLKYGDVKGYTAPSKGLIIKEDTEFCFDIDRQWYTINVKDVQNPDGSTTTRTYNGFYGDTVSFADLMETGTNDTGNSVYTKFLKITKADDEDVLVDSKTKIDLNFAESYGTDVQLKAHYTDNSATATYTFDGIDAPAVDIKFKKGEIPYFEGLNEYVEKHGGEGTTILSVSPVMEKVEHSITYVVTCKKAAPAPKFALKFNTGKGSSISTQYYTEGSMIFVPPTPVRKGYEFVGWYADENYNNEFSFEKMPGKEITIYAKWAANKYTVKYQSAYSDDFEKEIFYDQPYDLSAPEKDENYRFEGWMLNGEVVKDNTIFNEIDNVTLVAKWVEKITIPRDAVDHTIQQYPDVSSHQFDLKLVSYADLTNYQISYRLNGSDSDFTSSVPTKEGSYDVRVFRENDDYYKEYDHIFNNVLIIGKITLNLTNFKVATIGNTLVMRRPDGYKGDGEIVYTAVWKHIVLGKMTYTNSTGVFNELPSGTYTCSVEVKDGTYYKGATISAGTVYVSGVSTSDSGFSYSAHVKTGSDGGSWNDVYVRLDYRDDSSSEWKYLSDPDRGATQMGDISSSVYPWAIKGVSVKLELYSLYLEDNWHCEYVDVYAKKGNVNVSDRFSFYEWLGPGDSKERDTSNFKRDIGFSDSNAKYFNGIDYVYLDGNNKTTSYIYDYSGEVNDQYYPNGYNPMALYSPPTFNVTTENTDLLRYVQYIDVTKFKLDIDGLREYVERTGQSSFYYTVNYSFPSETCNSTTFCKNIYVDTNLFNRNKSFNLFSTGSAPSDYSASAGKVDAYEGKEVTVPVDLKGTTPMWGVLANVEFDTSALEFTGFENNGIFVPAEFTTQNDLTKANFKFLAANDELDNITPNGNLINLKFKVKKDIPHQAYDVNVDVIQSVDVDGDINDVDVSNGWVNVTDSPVPPATEENCPDGTGVGDTDTQQSDEEKNGSKDNSKTDSEKTDENSQKEDTTVIPDGDVNRNLVMILMFILISSGALVILLRKKENQV